MAGWRWLRLGLWLLAGWGLLVLLQHARVG